MAYGDRDSPLRLQNEHFVTKSAEGILEKRMESAVT